MGAFDQLNVQGAIEASIRKAVFQFVPLFQFVEPLKLIAAGVRQALGLEKNPPVLGFVLEPAAVSVGQANAAVLKLIDWNAAAHSPLPPAPAAATLGQFAKSFGGPTQLAPVLTPKGAAIHARLAKLNKALGSAYLAGGADAAKAVLAQPEMLESLLFFKLRYDQLQGVGPVGVQGLLEGAESDLQVAKALAELSGSASPSSSSAGKTSSIEPTAQPASSAGAPPAAELGLVPLDQVAPTELEVEASAGASAGAVVAAAAALVLLALLLKGS